MLAVVSNSQGERSKNKRVCSYCRAGKVNVVNVKAPPMPGTKEPVSFQIKGKIPECVISIMRGMFPSVEVSDSDEFIDLDDSPVMNKIAEGMTPGKAVRADRELRGWSQKVLSEKLEISTQNLSEIERGKRSVSRRMAQKLSEIFGLPPESYFDFGMALCDKKVKYDARKK